MNNQEVGIYWALTLYHTWCWETGVYKEVNMDVPLGFKVFTAPVGPRRRHIKSNRRHIKSNSPTDQISNRNGVVKIEGKSCDLGGAIAAKKHCVCWVVWVAWSSVRDLLKQNLSQGLIHNWSLCATTEEATATWKPWTTMKRSPHPPQLKVARAEMKTQCNQKTNKEF